VPIAPSSINILSSIYLNLYKSSPLDPWSLTGLTLKVVVI